MAIEAGDIVWTITGDTRKLTAALEKGKRGAASLAASFQKHSRAIGAGMIVAGGIITGVMAKVVTDFARTGDEIQKMALRTGFSTEALSELGFAAERGGASLEDIEKATKKLSQTIFEAGEGTSTYVDALHGVGLEYDDIAGKSPEEQFLIVANALAEVEDQTTKVALAQEIFGRAGTKLLPMLADGAAGLEEMRQKARDLGLVFSQEAADKAAEFQDALTNLQGAMQGLVVQIGPIIADVLIPMIEKMVDGAKATAEWAKANPGLAEAITKIGGAVGVLLLVLGPMVLLLPAISAGVSLFGVSSGGASVGVGALALSSGALALSLAAVAAALVAVGAAGFVWSEVLVRWESLQKTQITTIDNIRATTKAQIETLREHGVVLDEDALKAMNLGERSRFLDIQIQELTATLEKQGFFLKEESAALSETAVAADISTQSMSDLMTQLAQGTGVFGNFQGATGQARDGQSQLAGSMNKAAGAASDVTASVEDVIAALAEMGIEVPPNIKGLGQLAKESSSFADSQSRQATATNDVAKALEAVLVQMRIISRGIAITGPQVQAMGTAYFRWEKGARGTSKGLEPIAGLLDENSVAMWGINPILWNTAFGYQALGRSAGFAADELERVTAALGSVGGFASGGVVPGFASGGVIPGFASGGRVVQVGERGPELAFLPVGTQILSNSESKQALSDAAEASRPINMTLNISPGAFAITESASATQTAEEIVDLIAVELGDRFRDAQVTF